jgi:alpha-amylase
LDILLIFEVHQPFRLKQNLFWKNQFFRRLDRKELFNYYFDEEANKEVFIRAAKKCYYPANQILLDLIDKYKNEKKQVKFAFSISGVFLEQCERFDKDVLETFKQLSETGCVEFLNQTYYHSISGLYPNKNEFIAQVKMHKQTVKSLLGYTPKVFENTELLYNNSIAEIIADLDYKGIFMEGAEKILGKRSPNFVYNPKSRKKLKILLRNYKLTDDIGFRFSARWWSEWPLTATKYSKWLAAEKGQCVNIFPDYETFGEHHWPETGIHSFLKHLPEAVLNFENLEFATPIEVIEKNLSVGEIDVPEASGTISWADLERDSSGWLGNAMQWAYFTNLIRLEPFIKESQDKEFLNLWRYFQTSDHLYYMFSSGGGPGEVHSYFSPFGSPMDAFVATQSTIFDFENRVRATILTTNEPFLFYYGAGKQKFTGEMVWSLKGFMDTIHKVDLKSIEFHNQRDDFSNWVKNSLKDKKLYKDLKKIRKQKINGEDLRTEILKKVAKRFIELKHLSRSALHFS